MLESGKSVEQTLTRSTRFIGHASLQFPFQVFQSARPKEHHPKRSISNDARAKARGKIGGRVHIEFYFALPKISLIHPRRIKMSTETKKVNSAFCSLSAHSRRAFVKDDKQRDMKSEVASTICSRPHGRGKYSVDNLFICRNLPRHRKRNEKKKRTLHTPYQLRSLCLIPHLSLAIPFKIVIISFHYHIQKTHRTRPRI